MAHSQALFSEIGSQSSDSDLETESESTEDFEIESETSENTEDIETETESIEIDSNSQIQTSREIGEAAANVQIENEITGSIATNEGVPKISRKVGEKHVQFEMVQGKRRDKLILHSIEEQQLYVRNKVLADGSVAYTCREKNCKARVFLKNGECFFAKPFFDHQHEKKEKEISEMRLLAKIKTTCAHPTPSQTTSQISEVREIFDEAVLE